MDKSEVLLRTVKAGAPMVKVELRGHTKTHIVKAGQTVNNNCHVYQVPILMLITVTMATTLLKTD